METIKWNVAQQMIKNKPITYLWFGTDWCGDCQMMIPIVNDVELQYKNDDNVQFIKVDAEEANLFRKDSIYKVKKIPTHIFIKNGEIKTILYEYIPQEVIIDKIEELKYE